MNRVKQPKSAPEIVAKFTKNKIWEKAYGPLVDDWMSVRETSIEVEQIEESRGYTLNESVRRCINELKETEYLKTRKVEKVKQSRSKKGKPRKYTTKASRHKLNAVTLWTDYLSERCYLNEQEKNMLEGMLAKAPVKNVLENRNLVPETIIKLLNSQFDLLKSAKTGELIRLFECFSELAPKWKKFDLIFDFALSEDRHANRLLSEFFKTIKREEEIRSDLRECMKKCPGELGETIMEHYSKFIKNRADRRAERVLPSGSVEPRIRKEFADSLAEEVLGREEIIARSLKKIGSRRARHLLPT